VLLKAVTREAEVALEVWRAANDVTGRLRFPAGADAVALALPKSDDEGKDARHGSLHA
jgi:hypothetical protein